jgi:uncharacterized SAM-binding protein YcdF (DUF218 family)
MFDSPQCLRPFTSLPLSFDWGIWNGLKLPVIFAITVLLVLGLVWLTQRWKRKTQRRVFCRLLGGIVIAIAFLSFADRGLAAFLPPDPGTPVDAIVLLGRGTDWRSSRVEMSVKLWKNKRAPLIFASGITDTPKMLGMLEEREVPANSRDGENCSLNTPENALFTAAILKARGIEKIILITDSSHLQRSLLDFQSQNFQQIIPIACPFPHTMSWSDQRILIAREYFFLVTSTIRQVFSGQRISDWNSPGNQQLLELAKDYGKSKAFSGG